MNNTTTKAAETAKKVGTTRNTGVRTMVQIAMLAAVATVLMLWECRFRLLHRVFIRWI